MQQSISERLGSCQNRLTNTEGIRPGEIVGARATSLPISLDGHKEQVESLRHFAWTMRKVTILLTAMLALGLLASMAGSAAAAENPVGPDDANPNWADNPGGNDCTTGHGNPASGYDSPGVTDDCGVANGGAPR